MIARFRFLLPTYVGMQLVDYPAMTVTAPDLPDYQITVHAPIRVRHEFPNPFGSQQVKFEDVWAGWIAVKPEDVLTGNVAGDKQQWWANCFVVDLRGDSFPRDDARYRLAAAVASILNDVLMQLRWRGGQHYIKPILVGEVDGHLTVKTQFHVEYLDDQYQALPKESGYRGWGALKFELQSGAITPEVWRQAWDDLTQGVEVPLWDQLLQDTAASEPDGRIVVTAFTALEAFIRRHVDQAAAKHGRNDRFWKWLIERDDDYGRQPSIAELLDQVLYFAVGRSLKTDAPQLWQKFQALKKARNRLVHEGHDPGLSRQHVLEHVRVTREIIDWVIQNERPVERVGVKLSIEPSDERSQSAASVLEPPAPDDPANHDGVVEPSE